MYKGKKLSVILPAYNEEESIADVICDFYETDFVDEIIVVDNNSKDKTVQVARRTKKARIVKEKRQGYGYAIWKGLEEAKGDILVTCDADKTYVAEDIKKLLAKSLRYDFVWASRVHKKYLLKGTNMGLVRRTANRAISKLIQILFSGPELTDLGATFRLLNRRPYEKIRQYFRTGGGHFQPELTILALLNRFSITEVPVHYGARSGKSKISGSFIGGLKTAKAMLGLIVQYRIQGLEG